MDCQGVTLFDRDYDAAFQKLLRGLPNPALPQAADASATSPRGATRKAELAYLERLRLEELLNTEKYTPMGGMSRQQSPRAEIRAVFELIQWGKDKLSREPRRFEGLAAGDDDRRMDEQEFKFTNHPRDTGNWYQAMAFCRWLSWRLGGGHDLKKVAEWAVRLPTEFEWEKAVRGTDGRVYPYKGEFDAAKGNTDETGIGQTSAVGIFPNGASPYGVMDMSGNVWEWCLSNFGKPAIDAWKENLRNDAIRVLRGGLWSWFLSLADARAVFRGSNPPARRGIRVGCRVVCVVRPPSP